MAQTSETTPNFGLNIYGPAESMTWEQFAADNQSIDTYAAKLSAPGETNWDSGNLIIENGTWTPILSGSTTAGNFNYSLQTGSYYRVGGLVLFNFSVTISSHSGSAGMITVSGLPFTTSSYHGYSMRMNNLFNIPCNAGMTGNNKILFALFNSGSYVTSSNLNSAGTLQVTGVFDIG